MTVITSKRKFREESRSSEYWDAKSGTCTIEYWYGHKDEFRVAPGGKFAMLWPFDSNRHDTADQAKQAAYALEDRFKGILETWRIGFDSYEVVTLFRHGLPETKKDTLVICTKDTDVTFRWQNAATAIQQIIDAYPLRLRVEIRNEDLMYKPMYSTIPSDTDESRLLLEIQPAINQRVENILQDAWKTIGFSMVSSRDGRMARQPVLFIGVKPRKVMAWDFLEDGILKEIDKLTPAGELRLQVELVPAITDLAITSFELTRIPQLLEDLQSKPDHGSSIGPQGVKTGAGSFGFYVDWMPKGSTETLKAFITCYHVIENAIPPNQRHLCNLYGIGLGKEAKGVPKIFLDYPAALDGDLTKKVYQKEIAEGDDPDGVKVRILGTIDRYRKQGGLGQVMMASGRRKNSEGRRMDWVLATLINQDDFRDNIPIRGMFTYKERMDGKVRYNGPYSNETVWGTEEMTSTPVENWVVKQGRITGRTVGEVQELKDRVNWENGMRSNEVAVHEVPLTGGGDFADSGDSGSMVLNSKKRLVGMVIGVSKNPWKTYVTPIQDIFDDIKLNGGGVVSLNR